MKKITMAVTLVSSVAFEVEVNDDAETATLKPVGEPRYHRVFMADDLRGLDDGQRATLLQAVTQATAETTAAYLKKEAMKEVESTSFENVITPKATA